MAATTIGACSGDDEPAEKTSLTAVTYNAGLAVGFVEASEERAPLTAEAIGSLDANVLCLQEVWRPEHVELVKNSISSRLPNSLFLDPDPGPTGDVPCQAGETDALLACITTNGCDKVCSDELVNCGLTNCGTELLALPSSCLQCVQANVGNALDDILSTCQAPAISYAYGGSFGIGLASSYPMKAQETKIFESTTNRRGVAYALLDTPFGDVHTFCTHLTAVFDDIAYPKPTGSWEEEQAAQVDQLIQWVGEKAGTDGRVLVMGDMNTGPAGSGYEAEVSAHYDRFIAAGLDNPYVADPAHSCTFCADNPIIARGNDDTTSSVIDHVLVRGFSDASASAERVLTEGVVVESCEKTLDSAYSDHYGVSVTLTKR